MELFGSNKKLKESEVEKLLTEEFGEEVEIQSSGSLGGGCINHASKIKTNMSCVL